jgi:hypothetical protein
VVGLAFRELEQLGQLRYLAFELHEAVDGVLVAGALGHQRASRFRIVPEAFALRTVVEVIDLSTQAVEVKDTSPAS